MKLRQEYSSPHSGGIKPRKDSDEFRKLRAQNPERKFAFQVNFGKYDLPVLATTTLFLQSCFEMVLAPAVTAGGRAGQLY
jgi:hypothetical protein